MMFLLHIYGPELKTYSPETIRFITDLGNLVLGTIGLGHWLDVINL